MDSRHMYLKYKAVIVDPRNRLLITSLYILIEEPAEVLFLGVLLSTGRSTEKMCIILTLVKEYGAMLGYFRLSCVWNIRHNPLYITWTWSAIDSFGNVIPPVFSRYLVLRLRIETTMKYDCCDDPRMIDTVQVYLNSMQIVNAGADAGACDIHISLWFRQRKKLPSTGLEPIFT